MAQLPVRSFALYKEPDFRREVGLRALTFISLGTIIGSGWLLSALTAARSAGGASIVSWVLAGAIIMLLALVHSELGAAYPLTGGTARWPRLAFGSLGGFTAGWVAWIGAVTLGPIEVEAALGYLDHKWPGLINATGSLTSKGLVVATMLMLLFTVINIRGVRWLAESNTITVLLKIAVSVLTVVVLIVLSFHPANFTAGGGFAPYGAHGVLAALPLGVVFTMQGFEQAVQLGSEARDPQRNVPRAVIGSVVISTLLYLALEVAFIGALNPGSLVRGWANAGGTGDFGPYATLATELGLSWLAVIIYIIAFISPASTGLVFVGVAARLSFALGHAGYVPRGASRMSSRGVPYTSIILAFVVGMICFLPFPSWQGLVGLVTGATVIMYAFAPITLLALRKADPHRTRPYRLPGASVLAPLAFIAANEVIYWTSWVTVQKLMLVIVAGYVIFGISYVRGPIERPPLDPRSLIWILPWFTGLTVISYLGQYDGIKVIPEWIDLGIVAVFSLVICYLAVQFRLPRERVATTVEVDKFELPIPIPVVSSGDLAFVDGEVRQLRYGQSELAVVDASTEVVTVNWTVSIGPEVFVSEAGNMVRLDNDMPVTLSVSPDLGIHRMTVSDLRGMLVDESFCTACEFVRVDLSATQSIFWERLPDGDLIIVGFGDHTSTFTDDGETLVKNLLDTTATPAVDHDEVLRYVRKLVQQYAPIRDHI